MPRQLITEKEIVDAAKAGKKQFETEKNALVTDAARDRAKNLGVAFVPKPDKKKEAKPEEATSPKRKLSELTIAVGCDHGGFKYKETLKPFLTELGCKVVDAGTNSEEAVDYPEFAYAVSRIVSAGEAAFGIVIDGAGIGSCMTANKVPGIRAACCHEEYSARNAREHNDANVLTLGSQLIGVGQMKVVVKAFLETWHGGGRHKKRVDKIMDVERRFLKR